MTHSSEIFTTSAGSYAKEVIKSKVVILIAVAMIVLIASIIAAFYDLRWLFVGMIILFLAIPFVVFNAYFFNLLSKEAQMALKSKKVIFSDQGGITLEYFNENEDGSFEPTGEQKYLSDEDIKRVKIGEDSIVIYLNKGKPSFLLVAKDVLTDEALKILYYRYVDLRSYS